MKKIFRMLLSVVVAVSMSGCIWVVDNKDKEPDGTNNEGSTDSGNTPEEGNAGAEKYMSFVFDPQPTEYEGFMQINIYPSDQFLYFAWDTVRASTTLSYGTVEAYVKARVAKAVENGETYAGWKSEGKICCCSNLGWTMEFEPNTEYYVYAFQVNGEKLAIYGHVSSHKFKTPMASAQPETPTIVEKAPDGYLDMGLPSGTHWYYNATGWWDYYTYSELNAMIPGKDKGAAIPTEEQWNELRQYCKWEWDGAGFNVDSKNGNKLGFYLPFIGAYNGEEKLNDGTHGYYWTSSESGGQVNMAVINEYGDIEFKTVSKTGQWKTSGIFVWKP